MVNQQWLCPPGAIWQCLETFPVVTTRWRGPTVIWYVKARDVTNHPTMHRSAPPHPKGISGSKYQECPRLRNSAMVKSLNVLIICSFCGSHDCCSSWKVLPIGLRPTTKKREWGWHREAKFGYVHYKGLLQRKLFEKISSFESTPGSTTSCACFPPVTWVQIPASLVVTLSKLLPL